MKNQAAVFSCLIDCHRNYKYKNKTLLTSHTYSKSDRLDCSAVDVCCGGPKLVAMMLFTPTDCGATCTVPADVVVLGFYLSMKNQ